VKKIKANFFLKSFSGLLFNKFINKNLRKKTSDSVCSRISWDAYLKGGVGIKFHQSGANVIFSAYYNRPCNLDALNKL